MDGNEKHAFPMSTHLVTFVYYYNFFFFAARCYTTTSPGVLRRSEEAFLLLLFSCVYPQHCGSFSLPCSYWIIIYLSPLIVLIPPLSLLWNYYYLRHSSGTRKPLDNYFFWFNNLSYSTSRTSGGRNLLDIFRFKANTLIVIIIIITPSS